MLRLRCLLDIQRKIWADRWLWDSVAARYQLLEIQQFITMIIYYPTVSVGQKPGSHLSG